MVYLFRMHWWKGESNVHPRECHTKVIAGQDTLNSASLKCTHSLRLSCNQCYSVNYQLTALSSQSSMKKHNYFNTRQIANISEIVENQQSANVSFFPGSGCFVKCDVNNKIVL